MSSSFNRRIKILSIIIILIGFVFIGKLFSLQIIHRETYKEEANNQYYTKASNLFERGTIFFKGKDGRLMSAAMQSTGFGIEINPSKIEEIKEQDILDQLNQITQIDEEDYFAKVAKKRDPSEIIARKLSEEQAKEINSLGLDGVTVFRDKWRFYPGENLASHTLGFVAYKGDDLAGRYGLERQYEGRLTRGENEPYVNFFAEVFSNIRDTLFDSEEKQGDIVTTIEPVVQGLLERELSAVKKRYSTDKVAGIIMDPKTGAIYAMSAKPDFDLNDFGNSNLSVFPNPLVENVLEFGSVVKPIVMASALDAGVVTAETSYNDTGSVWVEKKEIFNFDKKGRGPGTTMQEVISQSLNTGMVLVYQKLGKQRMRDYLQSFDVGEKSGIDLPNESEGLTSNLKSPRDIEYANASFGQGIALTPIGLIRSLGALANDGVMVTPHVVQSIRYEGGFEEKIEYDTEPTDITPETSEEITRMMVILVDEGLQNGEVKLPHHSVAAKTGTAQIPNPIDGGYYTDRNTHSFFGYFPAYDPQFIILLYAIHPKGVRYASQTWTEPFFNITKFLLNYYEVPPDR